MKLLIHDMGEAEFAAVAKDYEGWTVISDNGTIRPCVGCFGCWTMQPGQCVMRDGYERMGCLIHEADEVAVITRYTYGGFSPFVKNVFDRSIGVVLPFFEVVDGEMHHQRRYPETKPVTFHFRGERLTEAEQRKAWRYVTAVCRNLRGRVKDVTFTECPAEAHRLSPITQVPGGKAVLLNCSLRGKQANTERFLDSLSARLRQTPERLELTAYLRDPDTLTEKLAKAERIVLGTPLYVDGLPAQTLRVMRALSARSYDNGKRIYVVSNMGLYESIQLRNLMGMVQSWCDESGYVYGGGVAIGAGAMFGTVSPEQLPGRHITEALRTLAGAIDTGECAGDLSAEPFAFPRAAYILAANSSWPRHAREHGLTKQDLYRAE